MDKGQGPYFCPDCAQMAGLLAFYPELKQQLEVRYLDFQRPRAELVELLGEENQSCRVLVLKEAPSGVPPELPLREARGRWFLEGAHEIAHYLAHASGIGISH